MSRPVLHRGQGVPPKDYELTRADHDWQKDCEVIRKAVAEQSAKWRADTVTTRPRHGR